MRNKTKLVHGVGVNDADYSVRPTVDGKVVACPFYQTWTAMLERCYSAKLHARKPTYIGCSVAPKWHSFMAFREWMMSQDWEGKELDKDILIEGNKVYGPLFCVFVDSKTNNLLNDRAAARGDLPMGVKMHRKRYQARCSKGGKYTSLGSYTTPEEAHEVYKRFKAEVIREAALQQPDKRVRSALISRAAKLLNNPSFVK